MQLVNIKYVTLPRTLVLNEMFNNQAESLLDLFAWAVLSLRYCGLFPYNHNPGRNRFQISWPLFVLTVLHLVIYVFVNASLLMKDWRDYAQPVSSNSILAVYGNLLLRLFGVGSTFVILLPTLVGSGSVVRHINQMLTFANEFVEMGLDIQSLNQRLRYLSIVSCVALVTWIGLYSWHAVYFYKLMTNRDPSFLHYLGVALSDFYQLLFIFFLWIQLFALCYMSKQLNRAMLELLKDEKKRFEQKRQKAIVWIKG